MRRMDAEGRRPTGAVMWSSAGVVAVSGVRSLRGHQALVPSKAVMLGTRKIDITNAEMTNPAATEKPILRDLSALLAVYEENIDDLIESMQQVHSWLAGPGGSVADRLRATAATETIGAVLSSGRTPDQASDDLVREVVLDAALAVLGRRQALG